ncbi:helix-turn-helix domain-containing protein [Sphingobacterium alkalisoli]|uniref:Helix-turn-helix domain-containing protein n=1 Tax=Sphingobacterium alkalisoli TaxID=1874115 RepID=A0A4V5LXQ8_9SPHI|nr:AraC family transcriptional regulator [Sphingobacterium alkalisoli]TJY63509.1 helix-turn-helix domain-containing protein [Sphingobacterium alkalisoli]GGH26524.1 AraC family transcriptional regulator [Sphingobacterium alkalisoli]
MKTIQFNVPAPKDRSVYVQEDRLDHFYPYLHRHEEYQIMWIVKGNGTLLVDDSFHTFKQDDVFLLGPNQAHVFKSTPSSATHEDVQSVSVFFNPKGSLSNMFNMPELSALLDFISKNARGFKVPDNYIARVKRRISILKDSHQMDQLMNFFYLLRALNQVSAELKPLSISAVNQHDEDGFLRINSVCKFIKDNYKNNITLEDAAGHANLTPQAFCRYFKKHTGLTLVTYINEIRIQEACKLLTAKRYESISLVAYNCGFNSITNFNRVFRFIVGQSPKEYFLKYSNSLYQ